MKRWRSLQQMPRTLPSCWIDGAGIEFSLPLGARELRRRIASPASQRREMAIAGTNGDACRPRASLASQNACQQESCVDRFISTASPSRAASPRHVPPGRFQLRKFLCAGGKHARWSRTRRALVSAYPRWQSEANTAHTTLRHFIVICARDKPIPTLESILEHSSSNSPYE